MIDLTSVATLSASISLLLLICTDHSLVKYFSDAPFAKYFAHAVVAVNRGTKYKDAPSNMPRFKNNVAAVLELHQMGRTKTTRQ